MEPITPQPGNAKSASAFVGREDMTRRAEQRLSDGQNLLLTDPRRMGKTQWLRHMQRSTKAFTPVFINYESVRTADELFAQTALALIQTADLPSKFVSALKQMFTYVDEFSVAGTKIRPGFGTAAERLQHIVNALDDESRTQAGRPVLLLIDELPIAIRNITASQSPQDAREVLQTLRALRASASNVRWILCGSIGLHHVIHQCGATQGDVNDLQNIPLGPLDETEALELAHRLLLGAGCVGPDNSTIARLSDQCGQIPFLMHKIAQIVAERAISTPSADDIDEVFQDFLDDRDESGAVSHFIERFDVNYGDEQNEAMVMLDGIALSGESSTAALLGDDDSRPSRLRLMQLLIDDHYLVERRSLLTWRYPVLQRVWIHRRKLTQ